MTATFLRSAFFLILICLIQTGCGDSSSESAQSRTYQFGATEVEVSEAGGVVNLTLRGVDSEINYSVENSNNETVRTGTIDSSNFANWLTHPASIGHSFRELEQVDVTNGSEIKKYQIIDSSGFSFDEASSSFTFVVSELPSESSNRVKRSLESGFFGVHIHSNYYGNPAECGHVTPPTVEGLSFMLADHYKQNWNDHGSGGDHDVSIWEPISTTTGYRRLGDMAIANYEYPPERGCYSMLVKADDPSSDLLKEPINYEKVWDDIGSGAHLNVALWRAQAPEGYTCMGDYSYPDHYSQPRQDLISCVKTELLTLEDLAWVYNDHGTGTHGDLSIYEILKYSPQKTSNLFRAVDNYDAPGVEAYKAYMFKE